MSGKIRFTTETENKNGLEFLDLRFELKGCNKITVDVYSKPTNSFTCVNSKTCYFSRNINKIPKDFALKLRCIFDSDEKYEKKSKLIPKLLRKPNKIWVDKGSKFHNSSFKKWLKDNDLEIYSTHKEGKHCCC